MRPAFRAGWDTQSTESDLLRRFPVRPHLRCASLVLFLAWVRRPRLLLLRALNLYGSTPATRLRAMTRARVPRNDRASEPEGAALHGAMRSAVSPYLTRRPSSLTQLEYYLVLKRSRVGFCATIPDAGPRGTWRCASSNPMGSCRCSAFRRKRRSPCCTCAMAIRRRPCDPSSRGQSCA